MTLGFVFESARSKRSPEDAPVQERMRGKGVRRRPDADQKKVRRQMLRTEQDQRRTAAVGPSTAPEESTTMSESFQQREAALLRQMTASHDLAEQRRLSEELEQVRAQRTASIADARAIDLADTMIRDTFTPVAVHERHTAATDWVLEQQTGGYDAAAADHSMRTKATLWFEALHEAVKEDTEEFTEQARGMARREAGAYGEDALIVSQAFFDTAQRLRTQAGYVTAADMPHSTPAGGQNGQGESTVTNYDAAPPDDQPFDSDFWSGDETGGAKGVHPDMPGAGEGQEQHVSRRAQASGAFCPQCSYRGEGEVGDSCPECGAKMQGHPPTRPQDRTAAEEQTCEVCGDKIAKDPSSEDPSTYHHDNGEKHDHEAKPKTASKAASIMVRNVGIAGPGVGSGTTEDGTRITFSISPQEEADLKSVLYGDMAVNFSGVEIEQSDIISEQGGGNSMTGPSRSASLKTARALSEIAADIDDDWGDNVNYAARPYLDAMLHMESINDKFGEDEGKWVVAYFLNNAASYRGEKAKALKDELKALQKGASKTAARTATCAICGKPIEYFDYSWYHLSADGPIDWETHGPQTYPAPGSEKEASKTAGEVPEAFKEQWDKKPDSDSKDGAEDKGDDDSADGDKKPWEKESSLDMWGSLNTDAPTAPSGPTHTSGLIGLSAQGALQRLADDSGNGQNGNADSGLPDEPEGDTSKVMWPVELVDGDPKTGEGAADVASVATPGGESGYPQPSSKSSSLTPEQAAFRARVQANLR